MVKKNTRPEILLIILSFGLSLFLFVLTLMFPTPEFRAFFIREGGVVETISGLGYLAVILGMALGGGKFFLKQHAALVIILLTFTAREFDFDKRFTDMGVLKSRFYVSADIPILQKLMAGAIVLGILVVVGVAVKTYGVRFISGLRNGVTYKWAIGIGILVLVISKGVLDGFPRKMADLGIEISVSGKYVMADFEECLEIAIPLLFLIGTWGFFRHSSTNVGNSVSRFL